MGHDFKTNFKDSFQQRRIFHDLVKDTVCRIPVAAVHSLLRFDR